MTLFLLIVENGVQRHVELPELDAEARAALAEPIIDIDHEQALAEMDLGARFASLVRLLELNAPDCILEGAAKSVSKRLERLRTLRAACCERINARMAETSFEEEEL